MIPDDLLFSAVDVSEDDLFYGLYLKTKNKSKPIKTEIVKAELNCDVDINGFITGIEIIIPKKFIDEEIKKKYNDE